MDLFADFEDLKPFSSEQFTSISTSDLNLFFISKTELGEPIFLIRTENIEYFNTFDYRCLELQFIKNCEITTYAGTHKEDIISIKCKKSYQNLYHTFIYSIHSILDQIKERLSAKKIHSLIKNLIRLFEDLGSPALKDTLGLWGEIFLIYKSKNPDLYIQYWRSDKYSTFDFSTPHLHVEVKTTLSNVRRHTFSLSQLQKNNEVIFASILTSLSDSGLSLTDLCEAISKRLESEENRIKIWANVIKTIGALDDRKFCIKTADKSMGFFKSNSIPSIVEKIDDRISNVKFDVDLTGIEPTQEDLIF